MNGSSNLERRKAIAYAWGQQAFYDIGDDVESSMLYRYALTHSVIAGSLTVEEDTVWRVFVQGLHDERNKVKKFTCYRCHARCLDQTCGCCHQHICDNCKAGPFLAGDMISCRNSRCIVVVRQWNAEVNVRLRERW